jgi:transcriptional regulator with XRE-family HTH domain
VIREVRQRRGLSQRSLAIRAGTQQATISRIERGEESPSYERFEQLLLVMGEHPVLRTEPLEHGCDPLHLEEERELSIDRRLERSFGWNHFAGEIALAGRRFKRGE